MWFRRRKMEKHVKAVPLGENVRGGFGDGCVLMSDEREIVRRAREIISEPEQFSRVYFARGWADESVDFADPRATKFCAVGALQRAAFEMTGDRSEAYAAAQGVQEVVRAARVGGDASSLMEINDREGHEAVLELFDAALEGRTVEHYERK